MNLDKNHEVIVKEPEAQSKKIRYGAPDGPRRTGSENYDGHTPLEYPGLETVAQYLALPKPFREFKSDNDLAKHFQVERMTIYRWKKDSDVIKRAHWLSMQNKIAGDLVARREYVLIMEIAVKMARKGNIAAMKFCVDRAFPEDKWADKSGLSSLSLEEVLERARIEHIKYAEIMTPTWLKERTKRLAKEPALSAMASIEQQAEPEAVNVNTRDASGEPNRADN